PPCAASRARAWCWRRPTASASFSCVPTRRSLPERSSASGAPFRFYTCAGARGRVSPAKWDPERACGAAGLRRAPPISPGRPSLAAPGGCRLGVGLVDEVVRADGLVRRFGGTSVIAGVDLVVAAGDAVALLGPNGAGKTTLLRLLALLLRPTGGRLALFGVEAAAAPPALRRRIGYVGHESLCYADLTAAENLAFYARLFEVPDAPRRIADLIAWAGLEG